MIAFNKSTIAGVWRSRGCALVVNLVLALALLMTARIVFIAWNWNLLGSSLDTDMLLSIFKGGLRFDLATLFYTNVLWIVLFLIPVYSLRWWNVTVKTVYVVLNGLAWLANLCDTVYVGFTGRRTTASVFAEFSHEDNMGTVVWNELLQSWLLVVVFIAGIMLLVWLYRKPTPRLRGWRSALASVACLAVMVLCAIGSIRGGIDRTTRPITLSNANQYVNRPIEATAVLNTPFSIIRSIGKSVFTPPAYMTAEEATALFNPLHEPADSLGEFKPMNVVVLIVESFSRAYVGSLNREINDSTYQGYTPCVDRIIENARAYKRSYANGAKSIDGMPSVLSSIPMMQEPFFLTPAAMNDVASLASLLGQEGYSSAFFHGAPNGSMGFEAFARHVGFDRYVGMDEYVASPRHNGKADFDGAWAIWDEPFLQFFAEELSEMPQPFMAGVFTASSHHPFKLPEQYVDTFHEDPIHPLLKCIRYTDMAIGRFFETASKQPWFDNTLFIITSDHSQYPPAPEFSTDMELFASPLIFYAPGDSTLRGIDYERIGQQIDIMPTVLNYLHYPRAYKAFGIDLFNAKPADTWAFNYTNGIYQLSRDGKYMQFDGDKVVGLYDFINDHMLTHNLATEGSDTGGSSCPQLEERTQAMEQFLRAFIQQYCTAMSTNSLTVKY